MAIKIICAWCGRTIRKEKGGECLVSHGMCPRCRLRVRKEIEDFCSQVQHDIRERSRKNGSDDDTGKCH